MIQLKKLFADDYNYSILSSYEDRFYCVKNLEKDGYFIVSNKNDFGKIIVKDLFINNNVDMEIIKTFNADYLLNKDARYLNPLDVALVNLILVLSQRPNLIILDDVLTCLNISHKFQFISYCDKKHIKIINYTSNEEELLLTDHMAIFRIKSDLIHGKTIDVLKKEALIKSLGYSIPFIVDLSLQLKDYKLVNRLYVNEDELVGEICKKIN